VVLLVLLRPWPRARLHSPADSHEESVRHATKKDVRAERDQGLVRVRAHAQPERERADAKRIAEDAIAPLVLNYIFKTPNP
jgi:hypothetical protein